MDMGCWDNKLKHKKEAVIEANIVYQSSLLQMDGKKLKVELIEINAFTLGITWLTSELVQDY